LTISQRGIIEVAKAVGVGRRTASGPSIAFGSLAVASVALLLLGFHADALSPLVFGTGFSSPAWLASAVVVTAMWVIVVARIGYRLPIPNSVASGGLLIAGIFAWSATQALFSGSLAGATGTAQTLA